MNFAVCALVVQVLVPGLDLRATGEASGQIERFESDTGAAP